MATLVDVSPGTVPASRKKSLRRRRVPEEMSPLTVIDGERDGCGVESWPKRTDTRDPKDLVIKCLRSTSDIE
jgi:hypothetical protein